MSAKQRNVLTYQRPEDQALFEETYQFYQEYRSQEKEVQKNRERAGNWVQSKLEEVFCERQDIEPESYAKFLEGDQRSYHEIQPKVLEYLAFSEEELSPLRRHEKPGKPVRKASVWLTREMGRKLCLEGDISKATWNRFQAGSYAPSEDTLQKLDDLLNLNEEEKTYLRRMVVRDVITDVSAISPEIRRRWEKWKRTMAREEDTSVGWDMLSTFQDYTGVSEKAMRVFIPTEGSRDPKHSSQGTLLKLTVAFRLNHTRKTMKTHADGLTEASAFLALADSGFYTLRDTVFCTCLALEKYDVEAVKNYLEFYAYNPKNPGKPRFENPYRENPYEK